MINKNDDVMCNIRVIDENDLPTEMVKIAADVGYQTGKMENMMALQKMENSATKKGICGVIIGGLIGYFVGKKVMKKKNKEKNLQNAYEKFTDLG